MKQRERAMQKLQSGLHAATVYTQQPGISLDPLIEEKKSPLHDNDQEINIIGNKEIPNELNNEIIIYSNTSVIKDQNSSQNNVNDYSSKRGPKPKGEFKKVTLNLDVELNRKLDGYINELRGKAIANGTEPPNKSEWVRDLIEKALHDLEIL
nr:hypothetical protein [Fredinandcohnia onubensis]